MNTLPPSVLPLLLALLFAGCRTAPVPQTAPAPGSAPEAAEANAAEEGGSVEDGACLPLPPDPALVARAEAGDAGAMAELGYHYSCGLANTVPEKAAYWFARAAEAGHSESRYELACRLRDGDGAPQDLPRAYALFCALADGRGDLRAAGAAGLMAAAGEGIPADYAAACRLLTLGAKGNPTLYLPLALLHAEGRGTPRNPTLAYDMLAVCDLAFLGNPLRDTVSEIREALVETYPELKGRTPDLDAFDIFD